MWSLCTALSDSRWHGYQHVSRHITSGMYTVKMERYFNSSLVTIVAAQCLPYGKQRMGTQVQPTLTLLVS